ncbi:hypothetical protein [Streptomyces sp. NPDC096012]|uniref:hypothetical protein n=1 Tax=Streptomyces sp. NPDC096012 TaxID=3155684 RepID=UPI00336AA6A6
MSRDRAAEITRTGTTVDVGETRTRFRTDGPLPGRFGPGLADRATHRRTWVEDTAGTGVAAVRRGAAALPAGH